MPRRDESASVVGTSTQAVQCVAVRGLMAQGLTKRASGTEGRKLAGVSAGATVGGGLDWLKWLIAVALLALGVFGNWYYQDESLLMRVIGLIAVAAVAVGIALQTQRGAAIWALLKEARGEIRRVVWPTRDETLQTTVIVLALVLVFALILWMLDSVLSWFVSSVIG